MRKKLIKQKIKKEYMCKKIRDKTKSRTNTIKD